jgi:predicted DNA binding CopG/RHH family protein
VTKTTSIRIVPADLLRARQLALKLGLPYQTYVKMIIHQALAAEEARLQRAA